MPYIPVSLSLIVVFADLIKRKIPNFVIVPLFVLGIVYNVLFGEIGAFAKTLIVALIGSTVLIFMWIKGGIRGGDVKYIIAIAQWMTVEQLLVTILGGVVLGSAAVFAYLYAQGRLSVFFIETMTKLCSDPKSLMEINANSIRIPFGACLAVSAIAVMLLLR